MRFNVSSVLIGMVVALVVASLSLFTVDQRQNAIVFRLGESIEHDKIKKHVHPP